MHYIATIFASAPALQPPGEFPARRAPTDWTDWLQCGYFATKLTCIRRNLPISGAFFDECMVEFWWASIGVTRGAGVADLVRIAEAVVSRQVQQGALGGAKSSLAGTPRWAI